MKIFGLYRKLLVYSAFIIGVVLLFTGCYWAGMYYLEGRPVRIVEALEFVTQTMTTVGYGQHAPWNHSLMYIFVIFVQFTGIAIVFLSVPIFVTPWLEERIAMRAPGHYSGEDDQVFLVHNTTQLDSIMTELEDRSIPYVMMDDREEYTSRLLREHRMVVSGDPEDLEDLRKAGAEEARLAILDGPDERKATVALALRELSVSYPIFAMAGDMGKVEHLKEAGVDEVLYPREVLGKMLGRRVLAGLGRQVYVSGASISFDGEPEHNLVIQEIPVRKGSELIGKSLREADVRSHTGASIIGIWRKGDLIENPGAEEKIKTNDILVGVGASEFLNRLVEMARVRKEERESKTKRVIIIGYGNTGKRVQKELKDRGIDPVIVAGKEDSEVDYAGDVTDSDLLKAAGIEQMDSIIVAPSTDEQAIMATLIARRLSPDAELFVRVIEDTFRESVYRAGALFVQSLTTMTQRIVAEKVLHEDLLGYQLSTNIRRVPAGELTGKKLWSEQIGERYNIIIIAVRRKDEVFMRFDDDFVFSSEDEIFVAGEDEDVNRFVEAYNL